MSWLRRQFERIDPRWFVLINNSILLFFGRELLGLQRDATQIIGGLLAGAVSELALARLTDKHGGLRVGDRLLSSTVAAVSTLVLLRSEYSWFYAVAVTIAIASKYVVTNALGKHLYNPTDFAIVFLLSFFPRLIFVRPDQFPTFVPLVGMIIAFGVMATVRARRWAVTLGYYATIFAIGLPLGAWLGYKSIWVLGPELNSSTLIFTGFMMTDPKTSPQRAARQWLFGAAIAFVHLYLRYRQIPFSPFIALFAVTTLRSLAFIKAAAPARAAVGE
jgi:Na+-translocating ferredoxin:NAD+ oxidoreductase RnfD subunit